MRRTLLPRCALSIALLVPVTLGTACNEETVGPETGADVEDLTDQDVFDNSEEFVGETVTVSARVSEVLTPKAFRIAGDDVGGEALLVIVRNNANVAEDDAVQVTGTVREFNLPDVERDLGEDLDDNVFDDFEDERYIDASSVSPAPVENS